MLDVELIALTTFELKLNPAAFKLLPVILPLTLTTEPNKLDPVIVPVAEINPPVSKLPPVILPLILRFDATSVPTIFPAVTLPVVEKSPVPTIPTVFTLPVELINAPTTDPPADSCPAAITLAPVTLPPALTAPVTDCVPLTCCPSTDQTTMFATLATFTTALPPEEGI